MPVKKKVSKAKKSKPKTKKPVKKKVVSSKPSQSMAMVTVPFSQIQKVEMYKGKMSVIPTPLTELQIRHLVAPTPKEVILKRPGKGGKSFDYIPGYYFRKKLNFTFGWLHDFEIIGERIDGDFVTVKGKLTIKNKNGDALIIKTDFGGHPIQYLKDKPKTPQNYVDISNDFKAASTDCLKRCAVQLGIGLDVYSAGEYTNPQQPDAPINGPVVVEQSQPLTPAPAKAQTIEAKATVVNKPASQLAMLNKRLEQLGHNSDSKKAEFVSMKGNIPITATQWKTLTEGHAGLIIAVLAKKLKGQR